MRNVRLALMLIAVLPLVAVAAVLHLVAVGAHAGTVLLIRPATAVRRKFEARKGATDGVR